jgi:hypothetical protein
MDDAPTDLVYLAPQFGRPAVHHRFNSRKRNIRFLRLVESAIPKLAV